MRRPLQLGVLLMVVLNIARAETLPTMDLATGPLTGQSNLHPNMLLMLSLDVSSAGIAHRHDETYVAATEYVGYFNARKCYEYRGGNRNIRDGYFAIKRHADPRHGCDGSTFSGNFMNWVSLSTLDILRYALTGGDRVIDAPTQTVLQRAVLPDAFYADSLHFPRRQISIMSGGTAPGQVTPFRVGTLHVVSCRDRILFSDSINAGNDCATPAHDSGGNLVKTDKVLGEFLARVEVCTAADALDRPHFCQRYGNHHKPVGELQRHARTMRFAVMGYLLGQTPARYGGVLRSAMKHAGPTEISATDFSEVLNEHAEWDAATGVLHPDPDPAASPRSQGRKSGTVNYLNQFGRSGEYPQYDPLSELYYEGLRYLQGQQGTPAATAGLSPALQDSFPVLSAWRDPVIAACQNTYVLAIADDATQWDRHVPGNHRTTYKNGLPAHDRARATEPHEPGKRHALDVMEQTARVADMESDATGRFGNANPLATMAGLQHKDTGDLGRGTYYMAGLAYWANVKRTRSDQHHVKTFVVDLDAGGNGAIDGSTRAVAPRDSQLYLAAKYGGFTDRNRDGNPFITASSGQRRIENNSEWDAAGRGYPGNYFLTGRPQDLIAAVRRIFSMVAQEQARGSADSRGLTVTSTILAPDQRHAYQAGFNAANWSGSLVKRTVRLEGDRVSLAANPEWDAADILTGDATREARPALHFRRIFTSRRELNRIRTIPFHWHELSAAQQALLDQSPDGSRADGLGEQRVDYLHGSRQLELGQPTGKFRPREYVLGDIIRSVPVYVGAPSAVAHDLAYQRFASAHRQRTHVVYVGANDGMLHAFDADTGVELFAYLPEALVSGLSQLTSSEYVHRSYVDGEIGVGDALVSGEWKTILAAGMGGGAQGVMVLDVTDPENFERAGAVFEFTDLDDSDMGNLTGTPHIVKIRVKSVKGLPEHGYFVVVPSGVNNARSDGAGRFSTTGEQAVFLLSLDKPPGVAWKLGKNYFKLKIPADRQKANGLAALTAVANTDGALRYLYAPDLQGNVWRLNFSGGAPWRDAFGKEPVRPFFVARDQNGVRQPITVQPRVVFAPGGYLVLLGTGKYLEHGDAAPAHFAPQSFYAVFDNGKAFDRPLERNDLAMRRLINTGAERGPPLALAAEAAFQVASQNPPDHQGWYLDYLDANRTGERSITPAKIVHGNVIFHTLIPAATPCGTASGRLYALDTLTGLSSDKALTGLLSFPPVAGMPPFLDTAVEIAVAGPFGKNRVRRKFSLIEPDHAQDSPGPRLNSPRVSGAIEPAGRLSWREIINWQELRDAAMAK